MIGSLRGVLLEIGADEVLIEVGGIGYRVTVSPTTAATLGSVGDEVLCWTHHHVREDTEALYGFLTRDERVCFEALLGAHGVGPALALAILSVHTPAALSQVLADEDAAALCLVPGVGRKTAERLLVELRSRLDLTVLSDGPVVTANGHDEPTSRRDVRQALAELGYSPDEVREALDDLPEVDGDSAGLLRHALQRLAGAR